MIKDIHEKPIDNTVFNGERPKAPSLWSGTRHRCSLSLLLFTVVPEVLARGIRQDKEMKGVGMGKEEADLSRGVIEVTKTSFACPMNFTGLD